MQYVTYNKNELLRVN